MKMLKMEDTDFALRNIIRAYDFAVLTIKYIDFDPHK